MKQTKHGGVGPKAFEKIPRRSVPEAIRFWADHNGCPKKPIEETRTGKAVCTMYAPGKEGSEVILWTLEDGGQRMAGWEIIIAGTTGRKGQY